MVEMRFVCVLALALAAACSDDGLPVQQDDAGASTGMSTATSGPASNSGSGGGSEGTGGGTTTGAPPDATAGSSTGGSATGMSTVSDSTGTDTGTDTDDSGSSSGSGSSTGGETEACMPITEDASDIGTDCMSDLDCEPGYTCQPFNGFVFEQTCQIICTEDCECPMGLSCLATADKVASWFQCG